MRELQTMRELASHHPRSPHVVQLLDHFDITGPNGFHTCLVYGLLGPSIPSAIDAHFSAGRLPGRLAKLIAKQSLAGLIDLHQRNIGHGGTVTHPRGDENEQCSPRVDLHTRNLAFAMPCLDKVNENVFFEILGKPEIGHVERRDGKDLERSVPRYVVKPTSYQNFFWNSPQSIKILDFGESFLCTAAPHTLHTPLPVRAPEVIFQDRIDYHADLWSMGCMVREVIQS